MLKIHVQSSYQPHTYAASVVGKSSQGGVGWGWLIVNYNLLYLQFCTSRVGSSGRYQKIPSLVFIWLCVIRRIVFFIFVFQRSFTADTKMISNHQVGWKWFETITTAQHTRTMKEFISSSLPQCILCNSSFSSIFNIASTYFNSCLNVNQNKFAIIVWENLIWFNVVLLSAKGFWTRGWKLEIFHLSYLRQAV